MKKFLFYLVFLFIGLLAVYGTLCYFGPKNLDVEISKQMKAPALSIFNQVNDFKHWNNWSFGNTKDSTLSINLDKNTEGKDARFSWSSMEGKVVVTIQESEIPKKVQINYKSDNEESNSIWNFTAMSKGKTMVKIIFSNNNKIPFLLRGLKLLTGAKYQVKNSLETNLNNISKIVENQYENNIYNGYKIVDLDLPEKHFVLKRGMVDPDNIQQFYAQNLGYLVQSLLKESIDMEGMPSGLFFKMGNKIDMAAAIPIKENIQFEALSTYTIQAGKALQVDFYGDYKTIDKAHEAIKNYMKDYNIFHNPPVIEEYITDPGTEKNPANWLTKITYFYNK